uniref:Uncharacterized protein n=1 Tax=Arundo donax TaxID=35708 RepID=A0A0A9B1Y2_ARUDO
MMGFNMQMISVNQHPANYSSRLIARGVKEYPFQYF